MRRDVAVENGGRDRAKIPAEVFVVAAVGDGYAGGHVDEQFVDDEALVAERDKVVRRQPAILAQLKRLRDAGRDILAAKDSR